MFRMALWFRRRHEGRVRTDFLTFSIGDKSLLANLDDSDIETTHDNPRNLFMKLSFDPCVEITNGL